MLESASSAGRVAQLIAELATRKLEKLMQGSFALTNCIYGVQVEHAKN
jgi:hypothetical protein